MRYDDEYRVVQKKRGGFWPFVGGLLLGVIAVKAVQTLTKDKKEVKPEKTTKEIENQTEIEMIESLIDDLISKPIKTDMDYSHLTYLRKKLGELRNG
jgi:superfamily I DNA and/or RNA helicase